MEVIKEQREILIDGLCSLTGLKKGLVREYAREHDILHILDHPAAAGVSERECRKIRLLKDFVNAYQYYRKNEAENRDELGSVYMAKAYFVSQLAFYRERELVLCAYMDTKMHVTSCEKISEGTVNQSAVYIREVLKRAIQLDAAGIILAHNHPGGSTEPSGHDLRLTQEFQRLLTSLGMNLFDHMIIADDQIFSMKEEGFLCHEAMNNNNYMGVGEEAEECGWVR